MYTRRKFIALSALGAALSSVSTRLMAKRPTSTSPVAVATWRNFAAVTTAGKLLEAGGSALDAVEQGVRVVEANPGDMSVGYGGRPDRNGDVTLDACIMDAQGNCGSVCFLQHIKHPVSVARKVMENTPHVILAGQGALEFALSQGFEREVLLTDASIREWKKWKKKAEYQPIINIENHDTIGMLTMDQQGDISGACTTSGLAYKLPGRVGDSPIIGAGLFVDNEVGGATATGMGEAVLKTLGSFLVVELMRQGRSPQAACEEAVKRIVSKQRFDNIQVGFLAMNKKGQTGAFCIQPGFVYSTYKNGKDELHKSNSFVKKARD
ncbi:MAG: N(4)-(beta-N-acetylglucosaminyl)-L-asparaginase [Bacteroidota bacterium]